MHKLLIIIILLSGCSTASYKRTTPDGTVIEVSGWEIGTDKALSGLTYVSKDVTVGVDSLEQNQTNGMAQLNQLVTSIVEGAVKGAK